MDEINELLTRGIANIIPNIQELEKLLGSKKKLNIYLGIDPTATKIHLGHAVPLRKLQKFAELGHNVTFLIGDFTALIGDTSDKDSERPILTAEQIEENFQTYKKQASKILDFSKVKVRFNSEWLKTLTYKDILKLKQQFSLNDFISRELIKNRLAQGKRVRLDETEYPIMQGYDSYFLDIDIQLGAADQTFNMQAGRTLQKVLRDKESYIIANTYLSGTDGRKMSKSWGNAIWLEDAPNDIYAKVMAIKDDLIIEYFTLATNISTEQINDVKKRLEKGENPRDIKKELAFEIVKELYDEKEAKDAENNFSQTVQNKEMPTDIPTITISEKLISPIDILIKTNLASSKSDAKRLIEQGGVEIDNEKITDANQEISIEDDIIIKVGKRKFARIKKE